MIDTLRALLPKGRLKRAFTVSVTGAALGQIIVLAASPLLTRLYTPEDFGILAVFSAFLGILGMAVCLCYELAIPLAEDDADGVNLLALSLAVTVVVSIAMGVAVEVWGEPITRLLNSEALGPLLWLLPVGLLAMGSARSLIYWAIRRHAFGRISRTRISRSLGQVAIQLGAGFLALGPIGLLIGQIVGQSAGITTLAVAFHRNEGRLWRAVGWRDMIRVAVRFSNQPKFGAGAALLSNGGRLAPAVLIAAIHGPEVAGWFALAQRILTTPTFFSVAVGQVYLGEASRLTRAGEGIYALFKATAWRLLAYGALTMGPLVVAGPQLFDLVFGSVWGEAGRYAQFLAFIALGQLVVGGILQTLTVLQRQDVQLTWDTIRFGALLLVFLAAQQLDWSPLLTVAVLSVIMTACHLVLFLMIRRMLLARIRASA